MSNENQNAEKKIYSIGLHRIRPMQNHPFGVRDDEEMTALVESIRESGVLTPIHVRAVRRENSHETEYFEIISGHRRFHACQLLGKSHIPTVISNLTPDQAVIAMVDSNLHREHLLPSEKAFAYRMKAEALNRQGRKTLGQVVSKSEDGRVTAEIGEETGESYKTVQRFIRLTHLQKELLDLVDTGRIAMTPAVELSYLNEQEQADLLEIVQSEEKTPSLSQAIRLKKISQESGLTPETIAEIMNEEKANQRETVKIPTERLRDILPSSYNCKQTEDFIVSACEYYARVLRRRREQEAR